MRQHMSELEEDILRRRRNYFAEEIKAPLMKSIINVGRFGYLRNIWNIFHIVWLGMKFPEPTKENTKNPVSHALLDIWEEFFQLEKNPGRNLLFKALRRITIGVLESSNYYSQRAVWFLMKLAKAYQDGRLPPSPAWSPMSHWLDPATEEARVQEIHKLFASIGSK